MGYAIRVTTRAVEAVAGSDQAAGIVAAEATGVKLGLRAKWGGGDLRSRPKSKLVPQGSGWTMEGASGSPYSSYAGTPVAGAFSPGMPQSPYMMSPGIGMTPPGATPGTPLPSTSSFGPPPTPLRSTSGGSTHLGPPRTPAYAPSPRFPSGSGSPSPVLGGAELSSNGNGNGYASTPGTPAYATFPASPNPANGNGFHFGPPPRGKKDD